MEARLNSVVMDIFKTKPTGVGFAVDMGNKKLYVEPSKEKQTIKAVVNGKGCEKCGVVVPKALKATFKVRHEGTCPVTNKPVNGVTCAQYEKDVASIGHVAIFKLTGAKLFGRAGKQVQAGHFGLGVETPVCGVKDLGSGKHKVASSMGLEMADHRLSLSGEVAPFTHEGSMTLTTQTCPHPAVKIGIKASCHVEPSEDGLKVGDEIEGAMSVNLPSKKNLRPSVTVRGRFPAYVIGADFSMRPKLGSRVSVGATFDAQRRTLTPGLNLELGL